jgi:1,4-dihydroxy-2-naphthoate octaprenyltransferase
MTRDRTVQPEHDPKPYRPSEVWLLATRPKTLPAAAAPVVLGTATAFNQGVFQLGPALAALLGALLLQVGANLANDVFDFQRGADVQGRLGPLRVTQEGLLTPTQVLLGMWLTFGLAALAGLYLIWVGGWPILVVGLLSILSAIAYTGGPFPLGYNGLGDLFVFIFFGLVAVCGTYYVQAGRLSALAVWTAIPAGVLVTAILVVNNLRDIPTDAAVGKRTLAVRLGLHGTRVEYRLLLVIAYLVPVLMVLLKVAGPWVLLAWISIPKALAVLRVVLEQEGRVLNTALAGTAQLALIYSLALSLGLVADRLF